MQVDAVHETVVSPRRSGLRAQVVRSFDALEPYEDAWNQLAFDAPQKVPTQSFAWVRSFLEISLDPGETWSCLLALDGEELVGVCPIVAEPFSVLGFPRLRLGTPRKMDIFSVDFLTAKGREAEVIPLFVETIKREYPQRYDFNLRRISDASRTFSVLQDGLPGQVVISDVTSRGSYLKIGPSFEQYRASLSHNFTRNLTKARNKLNKLPDVKTVFLAGAEATPDHLDRFLDVEASGWKGKAGSAIKGKAVSSRFWRECSRRLHKLGWLEWHFLLSGDKTLAGHLAIKLNRTLMLYKIGYDEAFSNCAPGNMLFEKTLERAFASGDTDEVDCIADMGWHKNWALPTRAYHDLWIYPMSFLSLTRGVLLKRARMGLRDVPGIVPAYRKVVRMINPKAEFVHPVG